MAMSKAEKARRETVHSQRIASAHRLSQKLGDESFEAYDKAYRLLERCKNLSLAFQGLDALESEANWVVCAEKRDRLLDRLARLNEELRPYGCHMQRAWAIDNVYDWDFDTNTPLNDRGYLHFF